MGRKSGAVAMKKFVRAPDPAAASALLRDLAARPWPSVPRQIDKPLVLYGAGNLGKMARVYLERVGVEFLYVVDANPQRYLDDPLWRGVAIVSPQDVPMAQRQRVLLAVCVVTVPFGDVSGPLAAAGWNDVVPFYDLAEACRDRHVLGNGWFAGGLSSADVARTEQVLVRWGDDASRAHHLQFIAWHGLREDWLFDDAPVSSDDRYFVPQLRQALRDDEVFVDIGAHHGEVSLKFMQIVGCRFKEIWMIEPDPENLGRIRVELQENGWSGDARVKVLNCALGEREGRQPFFEGAGYASKLSELGRTPVEVKTLDQLGVAPTLVKLHVEGGELAVLQGGLETIKRQRPMLAVTTYHNRLGLWELPGWLMDNLPDYVFLWRQHTWCGTGSIMYCFPHERVLGDGTFGKARYV